MFGSGKLKIAVVCSSNQNRSMEAHALLSKKGYNVRSFGTGANCKLPGSAPDKPNIYDFQTTYSEMYRDLESKDRQLKIGHVFQSCEAAVDLNFSELSSVSVRGEDGAVLFQDERVTTVPVKVGEATGAARIGYTRNGILSMLERNRRIKQRPERFQDCNEKFDVIVTVEERVYDQVLEDFNSRGQETGESVHVINIEIMDNHDEATLGAFTVFNLCQVLESDADVDKNIEELLLKFEKKYNRDILHTVCFY